MNRSARAIFFLFTLLLACAPRAVVAQGNEFQYQGERVVNSTVWSFLSKGEKRQVLQSIGDTSDPNIILEMAWAAPTNGATHFYRLLAFRMGYSGLTADDSHLNEAGKMAPQYVVDRVAVKAFLGNAYSQYTLGFAYDFALGVPLNLWQAVKWYERAEQQGEKRAARHLAKLHEIVKTRSLSSIRTVMFGRNLASVTRLERVLKTRASVGDSVSQFNLAQMYEQQVELLKHKKEAATWYSKSASAGYAPAQNRLAELYLSGESVPRNMMKGIDLLRQAAGQGYAPSAATLAKLYATSDEDPDLLIHWLDQAVRLGDISARFHFAWLLEHGRGVEKNFNKAISLYEEAANSGNYSAQERLAGLYYDGKVIPRDHQKALELYYRMARAYKTPTVLYRIGRLYYDGEIPHNCEYATDAFRMAADLGSADAKLILGKLNNSGECLPGKNRAAAERLFRSAALQGNPEASVELALLKLNGGDTALEYADAEEFLHRAIVDSRADRSIEADAKYLLGRIYQDGLGRGRNIELAQSLFRDASELGQVQADEELSSLRNQKIITALHWTLAILVGVLGIVTLGLKIRARIAHSASIQGTQAEIVRLPGVLERIPSEIRASMFDELPLDLIGKKLEQMPLVFRRRLVAWGNEEIFEKVVLAKLNDEERGSLMVGLKLECQDEILASLTPEEQRQLLKALPEPSQKYIMAKLSENERKAIERELASESTQARPRLTLVHSSEDGK